MAEDVAGATTAAPADDTAAAAAAVQQGDEAGSSSLQRARERARERVAARGVQVHHPEEVEVLDLTVDDDSDSSSTNADDVVAVTAAEGAAAAAAAAAGGSNGSVDDADGGTGMDAMMVTLDHSSSEDMCDVESETDSLFDAVADAAAAPAADNAAVAAAPAPAAAASPLSSADSGDSSAGSAVSAAETAVSDTFSLMSGAATESSAFSGMTAGTAFTLQSSSSGSGVSKMQEHLADNLLGALPAVHPTQQDTTPAAAACDGVGEEGVVGVCQEAEEVAVDGVSSSSNMTEEAAAVAVPTGAESLYASMYGSGLLLSADDIQGALQMAALPAADADTAPGAAADDTAASSSSAGVVTTVTAADIAGAASATAAPAPAATAGSGSSSGAVEGWQGDASLYASIIAHSEDHEQPGSPFNFGESFAAALTAAGLDSLSGPSPPSGSPRESDDWQIVEAEEEGGAAGGPVVAEGGAEGASSSSGGGGGGGSRLGRSWMGGRGTA